MLDGSDPDAGKCLGGWVARPKLSLKPKGVSMRRYTIMGEWGEPSFGEWIDAVSSYFPGFNVTFTTGYWKGKPEQSFRLEILVDDDGDPNTTSLLKNLCERYRHMANQSEVWMTEDTVRVHKAVRPEPAPV